MEVTAGRPHEARRLQLFVCAVALLVIGVMGPAVPIASSQSAYFERLAKERGPNVHVARGWDRGTERASDGRRDKLRSSRSSA